MEEKEIINESPEQSSSTIQMSLYDMNKQMVAQEPDATKKYRKKWKKEIQEWINKTNCDYYMFYGLEISYFTVFVRDPSSTEKLTDILYECIDNIGILKSIELTHEKDAFEIWIAHEEEMTCLYLFPYDQAIERFGG